MQSFWMTKPFNDAIRDAVEQFKGRKDVEKLKYQITYMSMPPEDEGLHAFLYNQIIHF